MKKRTKVLISAMAAVVIVLVGILLWLDQIAKTAIEAGATYALGVQTQLDKARIGIFSGQFRLSGLKIANPEGFASDHFLNLNEGELIVSPTALLKDTVVVPKLAFSGIDMNLEKKDKKENYGVILENLNKQKTETGPEEEVVVEKEPQEEGKKFVIEEVLIRDVAVHADLIPIGGDASRITFRIPEIRLKNIGSDTDGGMVISELSGVLIQAIFMAVIEKGGELPGNMLKGLSAGLVGLGDLSVQTVEEVGKAAEEAGQALEKTADEVGKGIDKTLKGIEGLFKKDESK